MNNGNIKWLIFVIAFILGAIVPFVEYLVILELFYLLIPFSIVFVGSLFYIVVQFFFKNKRHNNVLYFACVMPTFFVSQVAVPFAVNQIQRTRCDKIISEMELGTAAADGRSNETSFGITIENFNEGGTFTVMYSRGFMVTEVYDSRVKSWKSMGWND